MKKVRSGFSMVELLMVMAVMAVLAAIAIPNMGASQDSATLTSMKSDARNAISELQAGYADTQSYYDVTGGTPNYEAGDNGLSKNPLGNGNYLSLSKDNTVYITTSPADPSNFVISVSNPGLPDKFVNFDTSTDGKIHVDAAADRTIGDDSDS